MDLLGTLPDKILGLPLRRPNIAKVKLTHPAPQCLQSLHGLIPLEKIPKELCVKIILPTDLTVHPFEDLILFVELQPMLPCFPIGGEYAL
jgi:hypothetical protein